MDGIASVTVFDAALAAIGSAAEQSAMPIKVNSLWACDALRDVMGNRPFSKTREPGWGKPAPSKEVHKPPHKEFGSHA